MSDMDAGEDFFAQILETQEEAVSLQQQLESTNFVLDATSDLVDALLEEYENLSAFALNTIQFMKHMIVKAEIHDGDKAFMAEMIAKEADLLELQNAFKEKGDE